MATKNADKQALSKVREALAEHGGQVAGHDNLQFEGDKFVIPTRYRGNLRSGIKFLMDYNESEEQFESFSRIYPFRPWDGAKVATDMFKESFGLTHGIKIPGSMFSPDQPPQNVEIPGPNGTSITIAWGRFALPILSHRDSYVEFDQVMHNELGPCFALQFYAQKKDRFVIEGVMKMLSELLPQRTIYRGQAFDGANMPNFLDLTRVDPRKVVYDASVMEKLDTNLWSPLRDTNVLRTAGLELKRSVLLAGPYGTGKTLAAILTAQHAVANGWTFLFVRPNSDDLDLAFKTAQMYAPAVIFFEDFDREGSASMEGDRISQLLDMFDGIGAKGRDIMVVLTTNHPDRLAKGMLRPGRLDALIRIGALDLAGVQTMVETLIPESNRDNLDYQRIYQAMDGYMPAFVKEAIDTTKRHAIARTGKLEAVLTTDDFVNAADGLRPQFELMEGISDELGADSLTKATTKVLEKVLVENIDPDYLLTNGR